MRSPFGCGPNPCEWPCGPLTTPVDCAQCIDPVPEFMTVRAVGWASNVCTNCESLDGDYNCPWVSSTPTVCQWQLPDFDFECTSGDFRSFRILVTVQETTASQVAIQVDLNFWELGEFTTYRTFVESNPIDCSAEYTLSVVTGQGTGCYTPLNVIVNPAT